MNAGGGAFTEICRRREATRSATSRKGVTVLENRKTPNSTQDKRSILTEEREERERLFTKGWAPGATLRPLTLWMRPGQGRKAPGLFRKVGVTPVPDVVREISRNTPLKIPSALGALRSEHNQYHNDTRCEPKPSKTRRQNHRTTDVHALSPLAFNLVGAVLKGTALYRAGPGVLGLKSFLCGWQKGLPDEPGHPG